MHFSSYYYLTDKLDTKEINKLNKKTIIIYRNYEEKYNNLNLLKKFKKKFTPIKPPQKYVN